MNTKKSKEFTNKEMAKEVAKRRGNDVFLLGKNKKGNDVWYVGTYSESLKKSKSYSTGKETYRDKRAPRRK